MASASVRKKYQGTGLYGVLARLFRSSPTQVRQASWGMLMVSPWVIGLVVFTLAPIIACIYLSFTDYEIAGSPVWVGLRNYVRALHLGNIFPAARSVPVDRLSLHAIWLTLVYAFITVPFSTAGSLAVAVLLNQKLRGTYVFRTLFFMPQLLPAIVSVELWKIILHPRVGILNNLLRAVGIGNPPGWYTDPKWALITVVIMGLWGSIGGSRMLIFLAGLQGVPVEMIEAAELDGAGTWAKFWHVTLPMISPTVLFNVILGVIGALQVFTIAYVGTQGGPAYSTWFIALHIYMEAFQYFRMGYASALAWIFAFILFVFTWLQMRMSNNWVYYAGES